MQRLISSYIIPALEKIPFHTFLLPVLFLANIYFQYSGLLSFREMGQALAALIVAFICALGVLTFFLKDAARSGVITTIAGIFYLYFGEIKSAWEVIVFSPFGRYMFFLPLTGAFFLLLCLKVVRLKNCRKLMRYLNMLFFIYVMMTIFTGYQFFRKFSAVKADEDKKDELVKAVERSGTIKDSTLPDIFFIMPDCYPSSQYQKEILDYDNSSFDKWLVAKGFYVVSSSTSNYNRTAFSIPSTLDLDYLHNIDTGNNHVSIEYSKALYVGKKNALYRWLKKFGYETLNLSILDLGNDKSIKKYNFIRASEWYVIFHNTLYERIRSDLLWRFTASKSSVITSENIARFKEYETYNAKVLDSLKALAATNNSIQSPRFVYAHLYLPHFPYFRDSTGRPFPDELLLYDSASMDRGRLRQYIQYTNSKLKDVVNQILDFERIRKTVIILQSDHGLDDMDASRPNDAFSNYKAVYFSDHDYKLLYPTMSNVNTFRIVINKYFGQHLPLLPDSSFYIFNR